MIAWLDDNELKVTWKEEEVEIKSPDSVTASFNIINMEFLKVQYFVLCPSTHTHTLYMYQ